MHETEVQRDPPAAASDLPQTAEHPSPETESRSERSEQSQSQQTEQTEQTEQTPPPQQVAPTPHPVAPAIVPRWVQLVLLPLAVVGVWELARAIGTLLIVIAAASVIALILNPLAKYLQRAVPRGIAIVLSYLAVLLIFAVIGALLSAPVSSQLSHFTDNFPHFVERANTDLVNIQNFLDRHHIRVHIAQQGHSALQTIEKKVLKSSGSILSFSRDVLGKLVTLSVDLILTFVLSVYMLVYARHIGDLARRWMPPGDGTPADDYPLLVQRAVSGYVRGQLLFSLIMGGSAAILMEVMGLIGLFPAGSHYAVFFGIFYGLMELIPYIGPIIGPVPPILVALATHPVSAIWLLIVFILLQQLEGHLVAPQVFRISLRINPIVVILTLLIGYQLFSVPGALLALPVATIARETFVYLRRHLVFEPWSSGQPRL